MTVWRRGEICLVDFNPDKGGEIGKLRPAIILSDEESNRFLETVMVVPLSTVIEEDALPYRYRIGRRGKLKHDSDACINEIRALTKRRVKERLGTLEAQELETIQDALCILIRS